MKQTGDYITEEKKKALGSRIKRIKRSQKKRNFGKLEYAKSLGDLSENAEYHQTREDQGKLEERIHKIEKNFTRISSCIWWRRRRELKLALRLLY